MQNYCTYTLFFKKKGKQVASSIKIDCAKEIEKAINKKFFYLKITGHKKLYALIEIIPIHERHSKLVIEATCLLSRTKTRRKKTYTKTRRKVTLVEKIPKKQANIYNNRPVLKRCA